MPDFDSLLLPGGLGDSPRHAPLLTDTPLTRCCDQSCGRAQDEGWPRAAPTSRTRLSVSPGRSHLGLGCPPSAGASVAMWPTCRDTPAQESRCCLSGGTGSRQESPDTTGCGSHTLLGSLLQTFTIAHTPVRTDSRPQTPKKTHCTRNYMVSG